MSDIPLLVRLRSHYNQPPQTRFEAADEIERLQFKLGALQRERDELHAALHNKDGDRVSIAQAEQTSADLLSILEESDTRRLAVFGEHTMKTTGPLGNVVDASHCPSCGQPLAGLAARVSISGMYDMHLFHPIDGSSVDEVIANWRAHNDLPARPAIVGGREVADLGPSSLCPAIVISMHDKELRRVGPMVFPNRPDTEAKVTEFREALLADPEIPALLREGSGS